MEFLPVQRDSRSFNAYVELFDTCFPGAGKYTLAYLMWQYANNPDGTVVGFDAWEGERLAAHYACVPGRAWVGGDVVPVLLSLNTATHPDFQGKGLFTRLADLTYQAGAAAGYDCVYGIANANSTPGFVRKLQFDLVTPLRACVGVGRLPYATADQPDLQFQRVRSEAALAWRANNPANPLRASRSGSGALLHAPALLAGLCEVAAHVPADVSALRQAACSPLRLFIGIAPQKCERVSAFADIPLRFRPSPLNLIYRSLSGRVARLEPDAVALTFLDFDAY